MNEKIKALKVQARDFYLDQEDLDCSNSDFVDLVTEKFAELIVRECANYVQFYYKDHACEIIAHDMKQHFGVK